jgi:hypothetical protein
MFVRYWYQKLFTDDLASDRQTKGAYNGILLVKGELVWLLPHRKLNPESRAFSHDPICRGALASHPSQRHKPCAPWVFSHSTAVTPHTHVTAETCPESERLSDL